MRQAIPKGSIGCISPAESHHDDTIFEDPYTYKSDRWLSNEYWAKRSRDMAFVQWWFLRHRCYGGKWAQQFDKVVWARLFTKWSVLYPTKKAATPLWGSALGTYFPVDGQKYYIRLEKRNWGFFYNNENAVDMILFLNNI